MLPGPGSRGMYNHANTHCPASSLTKGYKTAQHPKLNSTTILSIQTLSSIRSGFRANAASWCAFLAAGHLRRRQLLMINLTAWPLQPSGAEPIANAGKMVHQLARRKLQPCPLESRLRLGPKLPPRGLQSPDHRQNLEFAEGKPPSKRKCQ